MCKQKPIKKNSAALPRFYLDGEKESGAEKNS
jgi:hypothetical protein